MYVRVLIILLVFSASGFFFNFFGRILFLSFSLSLSLLSLLSHVFFDEKGEKKSARHRGIQEQSHERSSVKILTISVTGRIHMMGNRKEN